VGGPPAQAAGAGRLARAAAAMLDFAHMNMNSAASELGDPRSVARPGSLALLLRR
jgi:hypothetical protein